MVERNKAPALEVRGLHVYYGQSHALQGVDLSLHGGVLSVVGRNGMGKTTLCKAIMGMVPIASGTITFGGQSLVGKTPGEIARRGIGYVPQGRRLWRSLSVDEHLRLMARPNGAWSVDRIYSTFPRLAERKNNGGAQLSGGEQQMLAISRALLLNPKLLVMDEPTEGLAPVIVDQVADMLVRIGSEGDIDVLVIEQNIGVATSVSEDIAVMVNGHVSRLMESRLLASDKELQQRLLGVGRHGHEAEPEVSQTAAIRNGSQPKRADRVYVSNPTVPTRWSKLPSVRTLENLARTVSTVPSVRSVDSETPRRADPIADKVVLIVGGLERRGDELRFVSALLKEHGIPTRFIDLPDSQIETGGVSRQPVLVTDTRGAASGVQPDQARSLSGAAQAFVRMMNSQGAVAGAIGIAGLRDVAEIGAGLAALPSGTPRVLLAPATRAATSTFVDAPDIAIIGTPAETYGLSSLNRETLRGAALAIAGMARGRLHPVSEKTAQRKVLAITRYAGTEAVADQVAHQSHQFDVWGFSADGIGSGHISRLCQTQKIDVLVDLSMMDIADFVCGGTNPSGRLDVDSAHYVGTCGGLDSIRINAHAAATVRKNGRRVVSLSDGLLAMRVTIDEAAAIGRHVGTILNAMTGKVQLFLPEGGLSGFGRAKGILPDPQADAAMFNAIEKTVRRTSSRRLTRVPFNGNDPQLADAVLAEIQGDHGALRVTVGGRK